MRYDIGILHEKHPRASSLGLHWASGSAKNNLNPLMAQAIPVLAQGCRVEAEMALPHFPPAGQGTGAC